MSIGQSMTSEAPKYIIITFVVRFHTLIAPTNTSKSEHYDANEEKPGGSAKDNLAFECYESFVRTKPIKYSVYVVNADRRDGGAEDMPC